MLASSFAEVTSFVFFSIFAASSPSAVLARSISDCIAVAFASSAAVARVISLSKALSTFVASSFAAVASSVLVVILEARSASAAFARFDSAITAVAFASSAAFARVTSTSNALSILAASSCTEAIFSVFVVTLVASSPSAVLARSTSLSIAEAFASTELFISASALVERSTSAAIAVLFSLILVVLSPIFSRRLFSFSVARLISLAIASAFLSSAALARDSSAMIALAFACSALLALNTSSAIAFSFSLIALALSAIALALAASAARASFISCSMAIALAFSAARAVFASSTIASLFAFASSVTLSIFAFNSSSTALRASLSSLTASVMNAFETYTPLEFTVKILSEWELSTLIAALIWLGPPETPLSVISIVSVSSTSTSCIKVPTGIRIVLVTSPTMNSRTSSSVPASYSAPFKTLTAKSDKSIAYSLLPTSINKVDVPFLNAALIFAFKPPSATMIDLSVLSLTSEETVKSPFTLFSTVTFVVSVSVPLTLTAFTNAIESSISSKRADCVFNAFNTVVSLYLMFLAVPSTTYSPSSNLRILVEPLARFNSPLIRFLSASTVTVIPVFLPLSPLYAANGTSVSNASTLNCPSI